MSDGWYRQYRNLFDRVWAKDAKAVSVYIYLHCHAYVQRGRWHNYDIYRGSCPMSRAAIMEGTGLTEQEVKSRLKKLVAYGEIVVKTTNLGNIITVCDYDSYTEQESLFDFAASNETPNEQPVNNPARNQPIYNKKKEDNNIITPFSPYNMRERKAVVKEIQRKYNAMFEGRLPSYTKLYMETQMKVEECIRRFGLQSVDMVFEQVNSEPFSFGRNKSGREVSFQYIFDPNRFQEYLERAQLRLKKKTKPAEESAGTAMTEEPKPTGSWLDEYNSNPNWRPEEKR